MSVSNPTGSGGFVYRAERHSTLEANSTTAPRVGPGSYELDGHGPPVNPAPAPFHTSTERDGAASFTPGPGAYDLAAANSALVAGNSALCGVYGTNGFASHTARLHTDNTHLGKPGPGTYSAGPKWVKKSHRYSAPVSRQRLSFQRVATAPSIPANHQSYGYEEAPGTGLLVMQKAQEPQHTGVGLDRVGPGSYNPNDSQLAPRIGEKAPTWSHSRTQRGAKYHTDVPGPGAYHVAPGAKAGSGITVNINGVDVVFGGAGGSSSFASKAALTHQRALQDHEVTPGPGSYLQLPNRQRSSQPHFFGSTGPRGFEIDPVRSLASPTYFKSPGPGAYDEAARRSLSAGHKVGSFAEQNPFSATSARFGKDENGIPGVGEYKLDDAVSVMHDVSQRSAVGRSGVFGSCATRFSYNASGGGSNNQTAGGAAVAAVLGSAGGGTGMFGPGPGAYNPSVSPSRGAGTRVESSNFASHSERFVAPTSASKPDVGPRSSDDQTPVRGDPGARGPGAYDLSEPWKRRGSISQNAKAFGSDTKRSEVARGGTASTTPGPGRYQANVDLGAAFKPTVNTSPESAFGAAVGRFKEQPRYAPGPGQYDADKGAIQKRSYNVTYNA